MSWNIVCRSFNEGKEDGVGEEEEVPEYLQLHQMVVRKIGEIFRIVNQVGYIPLCDCDPLFVWPLIDIFNCSK